MFEIMSVDVGIMLNRRRGIKGMTVSLEFLDNPEGTVKEDLQDLLDHLDQRPKETIFQSPALQALLGHQDHQGCLWLGRRRNQEWVEATCLAKETIMESDKVKNDRTELILWNFNCSIKYIKFN